MKIPTIGQIWEAHWIYCLFGKNMKWMLLGWKYNKNGKIDRKKINIWNKKALGYMRNKIRGEKKHRKTWSMTYEWYIDLFHIYIFCDKHKLNRKSHHELMKMIHRNIKMNLGRCYL